MEGRPREIKEELQDRAAETEIQGRSAIETTELIDALPNPDPTTTTVFVRNRREGFKKMAQKDHGPSIKDDEQYEALREEGMSKEKAARIANTPREEAGRKGGEAAPYEEWTKEELEDRAAEIGIEGRSSMDKAELIRALRNH